jgi:hypothetical protein
MKPERSFRQQASAGFDKDLRTCDDVGVAGVFTPVMTDAADRGYEQHARRHDRGENLGVLAGCACRKSNPDILVVQPAENWAAKNLPDPFDGTRERRILLQG